MGPKCSHKFPYEGGRGRFDTEKDYVIMEARCYFAGFKGRGRGYECRNAETGEETLHMEQSLEDALILDQLNYLRL